MEIGALMMAKGHRSWKKDQRILFSLAQVFHPSNTLIPSGEPNEHGRRLPEGPREIARANINIQRGFKDNKYQNRWYPYINRQQFRMARRNVFPRISTKEQIRANLVGKS